LARTVLPKLNLPARTAKVEKLPLPKAEPAVLEEVSIVAD